MTRLKMVFIVALAATIVLYRELTNAPNKRAMRMQEREGNLPGMPTVKSGTHPGTINDDPKPSNQYYH